MIEEGADWIIIGLAILGAPLFAYAVFTYAISWDWGVFGK